MAAFWEMYLHEVLVRQGYRVTVHPEIAGSKRSPDFLAESDMGSFYLEATCYFEKDGTPGEERRRDRLYDAIKFVDNISVTNALFGDEAVQFGHDASGELVTRDIRHPNGFWRGPQGARNTRVSAVLLGNSIAPWSILERAPELWYHPFARQPLNTDLSFPSRKLDQQGFMVESEATTSMSRLFGLPDDWPGPEKPFLDD